mgnify:CR=1 FL=1
MIKAHGKNQGYEIAKYFLINLIFLKFLSFNNLIKDNGSKLSLKNAMNKEIPEKKRIVSFLENFDSLMQEKTLSRHIENKESNSLNLPNMFDFTYKPVFSQITVNDAHFNIIRDIFDELGKYNWSLSEFHPKENKERVTPKLLEDLFNSSNHTWIEEGKSSRKRKGIYYTPDVVANYLIMRSIEEVVNGSIQDTNFLLNSDLEKFNKSTLIKLESILLKIKILDPACGCGAFIIKSAHLLYQIRYRLCKLLQKRQNVSKLKIKEKILAKNLFGVDINREEVYLTKMRLILWFINHSTQNEHFFDDYNLYFNIKVGNSLVGYIDEYKATIEDPGKYNIDTLNDAFSTRILEQIGNSYLNSIFEKMFHWQYEFPSVFNEGDGFDCIIGNPPYIFIRGKNFTQIEKKYYKQVFLDDCESISTGKARQSGKINTFGLFLLRSIQLLRDGGIIGYIVPNTILRATTNDKIRHLILKETKILEISDLDSGVFDRVTASTILIFLQKTSDNLNYLTKINQDIISLKNRDFSTHLVNSGRFLTNVNCCFDIHVDDVVYELFVQMKLNSFPLKDILKALMEGIITRKRDGLLVKKDSSPLAKKCLRGKDIDRYKIKWTENQYILYDRDKLHRARPVWLHEAPEKLLIQRIGGNHFPLKVAYDNKQFYAFASLNVLVLKDKPKIDGILYQIKYLMAVLNSSLINTFYRLKYSNNSKLTVNVTKTYLESLPIKRVSTEIQEIIGKIVDILIILKIISKESEMADFFDGKLMDAIIFELYLLDTLELVHMVKQYLVPISTKEAAFPKIREIYGKISSNEPLMSKMNAILQSEKFKLIKSGNGKF